ncbi:hypothetical protein AT420_004621, partial [Escherichia coli]
CLMSGRYPAVVAPVPWQMSFVAMAGYSCTPCRTVATRATVSGCLTQDRMCNCNTVTRNAI